jgi:hypothetical protein
MFKCARPGCFSSAKNTCSACGIEQYCDSSCQKSDWKIHKAMCPTLKKLSTKIQPTYDVVRIIDEILISIKGKEIRVVEHVLSYAEYQFGRIVRGSD